MTFDNAPTEATTTAAEAFALKRGVCQDLTHIFIAAARSLAIPARYIGGHFHRDDGVTEQEAGHAWAEAFVPDLGWVAFDTANGQSRDRCPCPVAVGLDYLGAAPVRGSRYGGSGRGARRFGARQSGRQPAPKPELELAVTAPRRGRRAVRVADGAVSAWASLDVLDLPRICRDDPPSLRAAIRAMCSCLRCADVGRELARRVQHAQLLGGLPADAVALGLLRHRRSG